MLCFVLPFFVHVQRIIFLHRQEKSGDRWKYMICISCIVAPLRRKKEPMSNVKNACPRVDIGGQAVMEGVMMKAPDAIAITVRRPDGTMVVKREEYTPLSKKHKWMGWPIIRGMVNMATMLSMGMSTLQTSTEMLGIMEEEPTKFEKWLAAKLGKGIDKVVMAVAVVLAVILSVGLFVLVPAGIESLIKRVDASGVVATLVGGLTKIVLLIGYMIFCSFVPDVRRTFQYHGAEHKTVYCNEAGLPLTPENADQFSTLHPRCGTAFLLIVFVISMVLFLFVGRGIAQFLPRFLLHLALLPVVAGISYEVLKGLAHKDNLFTRICRWPGLQLQRLTTKKPDAKMLECAIVSMNVALHGMPEHAERTPEGYTILHSYKESEPGYVPAETEA